ncbi:MAG: hypothetical protein QM734_09860, partial [Cyclobacteriaceae bacterium]
LFGTYVPSTATVGSTYYYAIATNACNSIASTPINVQIGGPPTFTLQASGTPQVVCQNGIVTPFTVAVSSPYYPATVQWGYYDGTGRIAGTGTSYTSSNTAIGTTGYFVEAINLCGTTYGTRPGSVTVNALTTISIQPRSSQEVCQNSTPITLQVYAGGTSLTYQWYSNTSNSNSGGTPISGATSSTYVPSTATVGTNYYYVVVSGTCGVLTSSTSTIAVDAPIVITTQPSNQTICQGLSAAPISVSITGVITTYQWWSSTSSPSSGFNPISGATTSSYTPSTTTVGTTWYYLFMNGTCGQVKSNIITFIVNPQQATPNHYSVRGNNILSGWVCYSFCHCSFELSVV